MKHIKKIAALVLAIAMILSLSSVAFAADDTYTGSGNTNATSVAGTTMIPLAKSIIFFNANNVTEQVYEPNITFNYAVAPDTNLAADGTTATVTDSNTIVRNVYPGPVGGVTGTSITFASTNAAKSASPNGVEVEETGNLTFVANAFSKPGIYRYVITESVAGSGTEAENLAAAGLTARDADYIKTRYLDVYVKYVAVDDDNDASTPDVYELQMYGAVFFVTDQSASSGNEGKDSITTSTEKTTGFEPGVNPGTGTPSSYADDKNVDKYTTYNFTVKKTVSGTLADRNHEFPFYVTVANSINGARFTYTADGSETFTSATNNSGVVDLTAANFTIGADATNSTLKLKNDDQIVLIGLPTNQSTNLNVTVKEFNDTYDEYTLTANASNGGTLTTDPANGIMNPTNGTGALAAAFDLKTNDAADQTITFDNNLTEISPTGYVVRIAPYVLMLAGGIALLVVTRRRRREDSQAA